jgi:uncharacterized membrane protein
MDARNLHALLPVAIIAGLALSVYAAYESAYPAAQQSCSLNGFVSCSKVAQSSYSSTLGVPDYWAGIAGFLALFVVDVPLLRTYKPMWLRALLGLAGLGLVGSAYLAYVELAIIHALCLVCTGAYLANLVVFLAAFTLFLQARSEAAPVVPASAPSVP